MNQIINKDDYIDNFVFQLKLAAEWDNFHSKKDDSCIEMDESPEDFIASNERGPFYLASINEGWTNFYNFVRQLVKIDNLIKTGADKTDLQERNLLYHRIKMIDFLTKSSTNNEVIVIQSTEIELLKNLKFQNLIRHCDCIVKRAAQILYEIKNCSLEQEQSPFKDTLHSPLNSSRKNKAKQKIPKSFKTEQGQNYKERLLAMARR